MIQKDFLWQVFSSIFSDVHIDCSFDQPADVFPSQGETLRLDVGKWWKHFIFLPKKLVFLKTIPWTRRVQLWRGSRKVFEKRPLFHRWMAKKTWFFSKKTLITMFRWKRKILFRQPRRNFSSKRPKRFCSLSWKDGKQYFSEKLSFWNYSYVREECSFDVRAEIFST